MPETSPASGHTSSRRRWLRRLVRLAAILACCYIGAIIVLMALENSLLFHPSRADQDWLQPLPSIHAQDVELRAGMADDTLIHAWWCPPENWKNTDKAVLFCHGNGGNLSHRQDNVKQWQEALHAAVLIFDYPGYGKSTGKPSEAGCYAAADATFKWLVSNQQIPAENIILCGESLGCAVAVELASQKTHAALVLVSPFTSVPDMAQRMFPWLPTRWFVRNRFDNLAKIGHCHKPVFIAHGTSDSLVPIAHGKRLYDAANEPKKSLWMEGLDHNDRLTSDFYKTVARFLDPKSEGQR